MQKQKGINQTNWILPNEPFPLYQLERRKLKWASTPEKARRSLLWIAIPPIIALIVLWFVFIYRDSVSSDSWSQWVFNYIYAIFIASMTLLSGLLDFDSIVVTFSSMRDETVFNRLDLLTLAIEKEHITRSKHAFAKLRIARFLVFNLAIRVAVLLMVVLVFTVSGYFLGSISGTIAEIGDFLVEYPGQALWIICVSVLVTAFYLLEPIWRVSTITAMGIALSARIKNIALLAPMAFFVLAIMWILQGVVLAVFGFGIAWTSERFSNWYWNWTRTNYPDYPRPDFVYDLGNWFSFGGLLIALLLFLFVANRFYRILKGIAYKRIYARIP